MSGRVTAKRGGLPMKQRDWDVSEAFWSWLFEAADHAVDAWLIKPRIGDTKPSTGTVVFKPREHFRADGKPKSKRTLAEVQRIIQERPGFRFYVCSVCDAYHVGHEVKTQTIARLAVA